jgi:trehalose 6-phosphate synthase
MATNQTDNVRRLAELFGQKLPGCRLILASNRGPVEYYLAEDGQLRARRGSGGVVTALSGLSRYIELDWIASAMGEGDRQAAQKAQGRRFKVPSAAENLYLHFVVVSRSVYHKYYGVICNPLLWFLQHYMWSSYRTPNIDWVVHNAWETGYVPVNQAFAQAVINDTEEAESAIVLLNDYHLYLASSYIRQQRPDLIIQHFIHVPWPSPMYWHLLPGNMREAIFSSLCTTDIVGLQTERDVHSFLECCEEFIAGARVDSEQKTVQTNGHLVRVRSYPISIDVAGVRKLASSAAAKEYERKLSPLLGEQTIVRVDRLEPSKNIVRGFRAFDMLLERYPEFRGRLKFIAFLVPTRTHLKPYQRYMEETTELIGAINSKYGTADWHPIDFFYENNYLQAIAGMRLYDVLLVNSVLDGMNLVAKEGPTVNERGGVLIISETIGAYEQLGKHALSVAPTDLEGMTQALYAALTMPAEERKRRAAALKSSIETEDVTNWIWRLLGDAASLVEARSGPST